MSTAADAALELSRPEPAGSYAPAQPPDQIHQIHSY